MHIEAGQPPPQLLTVPQVARMLATSRRTVYRLIAAGDLATVRVRTSRRVPQSAVTAYVAALGALGAQVRTSPPAVGVGVAPEPGTRALAEGPDDAPEPARARTPRRAGARTPAGPPTGQPGRATS